jgi:hypothetical protein
MIARILPLLLLACTRMPPVAAPAPAPEQPEPRSLVEWAVDSATISCPYVGTSLTVAGDLRRDVTPQSPSAVVVRSNAPARGVLLATAEYDGRPLREQVLADFRWLHGVLTGSVPDRVTVTALEIHDGRIRARYALGPDPGEPTYDFDYLLVHRNGSSCRLGAVGAPIASFGTVRDTPGIDVAAPDASELLNGVLGFGLTLLR